MIEGLLVSLLVEITKKGFASLVSHHPLKKAISRTARQFDQIEGLSCHLERWLEQQTTQKVIAAFCRGRTDIEIQPLSDALVKKVGFYYGEESNEQACEIIGYFFKVLFEELLKGEEGPVYQGLRTEAIAQRIFEKQADIRETLEGVGAKILSNIQELKFSGTVAQLKEEYEDRVCEGYEKRIDSAKSLLENGKSKTAKALYDNLLEDLVRGGEKRPRLLFRVHTNLGCSELALGHELEAAGCYEQAHRILPNDYTGLTNMAIAQALKGDPEAGIEYVDRVLVQNPREIGALCAKATLLASSGKYGTAADLLKNATELLDDPRCSYSLGYVYYAEGNYRKARDPLKKAINRDPSNPDYVCLLANCLATPILRKGTHPRVTSERETRELEEANSLLSNALEILLKGENDRKTGDALVSRSAVRIALRRFQEAIDDCNDLVAMNRYSATAYRNKGIAELLGRNYADAVESFAEALAKGEPAAEIVPAVMRAYLSEDPPEPGKAIEWAERYFPTDEPEIDEKTLDVRIALVESYISDDQLGKAGGLLNRLQQTFPNTPKMLTAAARYNSAVGKELDSESCLIKAVENADDAEKPTASMILGDYYYRGGFYDKAIPLYAQVFELSGDLGVAQRYVICLYNSANRVESHEKCLEICTHLRKRHGVLGMISEIEAAINEELGKLRQASELYLGLYRKSPGHYAYNLRYGLVEFRRGNEKEALRVLDEVKGKVEGDAEALMSIAQVFDFVGRKKEAIKFGYDALQLASGDPQMHLAYIHLFLSYDDEAEEVLTPSTIGPDAAISLRFNGEERTYMLLDSETPNLGKGEVSIQSDLGQAVLGLRVGDSVRIGSPPSEEKARVTRITSKYVRLFQESMQNFNRLFRDKGLQKVRVGKDLKGLLEMVDGVSERASRVRDWYREQKLPLGTLSKLLGKDQFEVWDGLVEAPGMTLRCAAGSQEEQKDEADVVERSKRVVVDLVGLFTLAHIDCLETLSELFDEVYVNQSVLDELNQTLVKQKVLEKRGYTTIGKYKGQYAKVEVPREVVRERIALLNKTKDFVSQQGKVSGLARSPSQVEARMCELLGTSSGYSLLLAKQMGLPVYSDDKSLREIALSTYQIKAFGVQAVLKIALERQKLGNEVYHRKTIQLLLSNYSYISVTAHTLLFSARENRFGVGEDTDHLFEAIESPEASLDSVLSVLSDFLKLIWIEPIPRRRKLVFLDLSLRALTKRRGIRNTAGKLKRVLGIKLTLLPIHLDELLRDIRRWERAQPLVT